jgi:hypothetical protein
VRTALDYYRIFVGWGENAGSIQGALNDFKSLTPDRRTSFREILAAAIARKNIVGDQIQDALKFM